MTDGDKLHHDPRFLIGKQQASLMLCVVLQKPLSGHWRVCVWRMEGGRRKLLNFGQSKVLTKTLHVTPAIPMNNSEHRRMYGEIRQNTRPGIWHHQTRSRKAIGEKNCLSLPHVQGEAIREIHTDLTYGMIMNILSNSLKRTHTRADRECWEW